MDSAQPPFKEGIYIAGVGGSRVQEVHELEDSLDYRVRACHSKRGRRGGERAVEEVGGNKLKGWHKTTGTLQAHISSTRYL